MIPIQDVQKILIGELEKYTECTFVPSNTTKNIPPYPYVSFAVIRTETHKGTYHGREEIYNPADVTYSITVQSDKEAQAMEIAMKIKDYCEEYGRSFLAENGIVIQKTGEIVSRDNLITIEYEYRKGLDVVLALFNHISVPEEEEMEAFNFMHNVIRE